MCDFYTKVHSKARSIEGHVIIIKSSVHWGNMTIAALYTANDVASKYQSICLTRLM